MVLSLHLIAGLIGPLSAALDEGSFIPCSGSGYTGTESGPVYYTIKAGDTLWDISQRYNVDLQSLKNINNFDDGTVLSLGQKILLPGGKSRLHVVKKGETLWDIARSYNISLSQLHTTNQNLNPENLKIGMTLSLPESATSASPEYQAPSRSRSSSQFIWPLYGAITSSYGWRKSGFHHGTDISARYGEPVKAAASGSVTFTGYRSVYGRTVVLSHRDGSETLYAHLSQIAVSRGQLVNQGEVIGAVGTTGYTTGPHLHFEVKRSKKYVNPVSVLR